MDGQKLSRARISDLYAQPAFLREARRIALLGLEARDAAAHYIAHQWEALSPTTPTPMRPG